MPGRSVPLVRNEIYHVFNRGIDKRPTFTNKKEYKRALDIISFYKYATPPIRLSRYLLLNADKQEELLQRMKESQQLVEILAFCLMPNHFHFLLRQNEENGISKFMAVFLNSYTRYFNTKKERVGPLFLDQFKAVRIEDDSQLIHVMRYIHLNPLTSYVLKDFRELETYSWSSYREYLVLPLGQNICSLETIRNQFKTLKSFEKFHKDQVEYQRSLDKIKHLALE